MDHPRFEKSLAERAAVLEEGDPAAGPRGLDAKHEHREYRRQELYPSIL
jgi:hypothetical protein